jgi:hypothetical protein
VERLPETFQDAVSVCRILDISFLWIDALCIIQDSPQDWRFQSLKMGEIYQQASVTLAAHCAKDDSRGFLAAALARRQTIQFESTVGTIGICRLPDPEDISNSGLAKRAWVLQERYLSTRILHFTLGQIYYETISGISWDFGVVADSTMLERNVSDPEPPSYANRQQVLPH